MRVYGNDSIPFYHGNDNAYEWGLDDYYTRYDACGVYAAYELKQDHQQVAKHLQIGLVISFVLSVSNSVTILCFAL